MRCADCPYLSNGTRKRPICCMEEGIAARQVAAEAKIINRLAEARAGTDGPRTARAAALAGSMLTTNAGSFTPGAARYAAPLTAEETLRAAKGAANGARARPTPSTRERPLSPVRLIRNQLGPRATVIDPPQGD